MTDYLNTEDSPSPTDSGRLPKLYLKVEALIEEYESSDRPEEVEAIKYYRAILEEAKRRWALSP